MAEFASKGGAYGVGIPALVLGGLSFLQNGNLGGGLLGGGNCGGMQVLVSEQAGQIARLSAEKYADGVGINTFRESLAAMDKRFDENRGRINNLEKVVAEAAVREEAMRGEIRLLRCQVQGTYVPGKLVMPADAICPEQMPRYNSWTAPTGTAPAAAAASK